jgi:hypothetical protein
MRKEKVLPATGATSNKGDRSSGNSRGHQLKAIRLLEIETQQLSVLCEQLRCIRKSSLELRLDFRPDGVAAMADSWSDCRYQNRRI